MSRNILKDELLAIQVPNKDSERVMMEASLAGLLDRRRKVIHRNDYVEIPVTGCLSLHQTFHQQNPEFYRRTSGLVELLEDCLAPELKHILPRGWYITGNVIIVKIHPKLDWHKYLIGEALLSIYPRCRCVLKDSGVTGQLREPKREIIAGSGTETVHKENGVFFKLDAMRIMFSPGNLFERTRMRRLGHDETVVDMFAGIGYFTLPMAVHSRPRRIIAIELNPLAYGYLVENIRLNHVEDIVEPVLGNCLDETPYYAADRVIIGLFGSTNQYLRKGIEALRPGGILHYHQTVHSRLYPDCLKEEIISTSKELGREAEILRSARVKKYSPGVIHAVVDARII